MDKITHNFHCNNLGPVYEMMKRCDLNEKADGSFNLFPTIHDAVHRAMDNLVPIRIITEMSPKGIFDIQNSIVPPAGIYRAIYARDE